MASQHNMAVWRNCIRAWYPEYETKTYFVPPVVITRIPFDVVTVAGQSVLVPQTDPAQACVLTPNSSQVKIQRVQECNSRDDVALHKVLFYLRNLVSGQNEPMFVISQLQFSDYLRKLCIAAAAKQFLRPKDLSKEYRSGDFDILIIHRHYGIITGEMKSVLSNQQQLQSSQPDVDRVVIDKVRHAIKQLNKSEVILREITKDLDPNLAIRKLLILPYVTVDVLTRVASNNEQLKQNLVTCLQAEDFEQALQSCMLAENLSSSGTGTVNDQQPHTWWSTFTAVKHENRMTTSLYLDLLTRFCGPATTVSVYWPTSLRIEVRTEGQGVAITGGRMTSLVLTPEQINLLTRAPTKVFLTGQPGVGKSLMLILMALKWLRQGHNVHLVSVRIYSLAATHMIKHTIQLSLCNDPTTPSAVGRVHLHGYNFYNDETDVDKAINTLTETRGSHGPFVICDEFWTGNSHVFLYHQFVTKLCTTLPNICLWVASPFHQHIPAHLQEEVMTIPLRCPLEVFSEVQKGINRKISDKIPVHPYAENLAMPCDGPNIIHLRHQGTIHAGRWPLECTECGRSIAGILRRLGIGVTDKDSANPNTSTKAVATDESYTKKTFCPPLQYRDVFVLTRNLSLQDSIMDKAGHVTSPAHGVVRGLRDAGIPVRVIREGHESKDVCDTAVRQSDVVTVTDYAYVSGLERKVVVWLPGRVPGEEDYLADDIIEASDRFHAMSRCTAQLVVVDVPGV